MPTRLTMRLVVFVVALGLGILAGADWTATAAAPRPHAQASLAVNGEVIAAYQRYAGKFAVMSPSGGGATYVDCGGDLTYGGAPRYFINYVAGSNLIATTHFGSGGPYPNIELAVSDENCAQTTVMTHEGNKIFNGGTRWSPDGTMVAAFAHEFDLATGELSRQGIFVADVVYDSSGRPAGLTNLRLVVSPAGEYFAWAPDSQRLVYVDAGINGADLFVCSLDGASINITNTPNVAEDQPAWSATGRIAYTRQTSDPRGSWRYDIFTIPATGGSEVQITSKATTGSFANRLPAYSPDGLQMLFSSGLLQGDCSLYLIRADGAGKATKVIGGKNEDWRTSFWRR